MRITPVQLSGVRVCPAEMIKIGGINLAPLEVEQVLLKYPDRVQAYVVGIPEIVAAAVELRGRAATQSRAIVAFRRERLASYKVPARLAFGTAAQLPRARGAAPRDEAFGQVSGEP